MPVQRTGEDKSSPTPKIVKYAKKGQLRKLKNALNNGESLDVVDSRKRGVLYYAALKGHKKCLKELLKRGANPNQKNQDGQTPCHAAAMGGILPQFSNETCSTRNPLKGIYFCSKGVYNILSHYLYHSKHQRRCLEYLVMYGGDLKVQSLARETTRDVAVRRRQMAIVDMIEEYFELQTTASGYNIAKGWSMLRPFTSYPRSCPTWMHTVVSSRASFEDVSPMSSEAFPFYNERCKNVYDYGFVHPYDNRNNPGSLSGVPEVLPSEVSKTNDQECQSTQSIDGSMWSMGSWGRNVSVTLRQLTSDGYSRSIMNVVYLIGEMDSLSTLRHSNIVLLMAVCCGPTKTDMFLAMEPLQIRSLYDQLHHQHVKISKQRSAEIIWDVTCAVAYLHTVKRVTHNMISSHAVYFTPNGTTKLCNVFCCHPPDTMLPGKFNSALRLFLAWMAPELMQTRITTYECDVYSIGVLLWEIWAKEPPWPGLSPPQLGRVLVDEGQRLPLTKNHLDVSPILNSCFGPPVGRLPIEQLLSQVSYLKTTPVLPNRT